MPNSTTNLSATSGMPIRISQEEAVFMMLFRAWIGIAKQYLYASDQHLTSLYGPCYTFILFEGQHTDISMTDAFLGCIFLPEQAFVFLNALLDKLPTQIATTSASQMSLPEHMSLASQFIQLHSLTGGDAIATQKIIIETLKLSSEINIESRAIWKQTSIALEALSQPKTLARFIEAPVYDDTHIHKAMKFTYTHPILAHYLLTKILTYYPSSILSLKPWEPSPGIRLSRSIFPEGLRTLFNALKYNDNLTSLVLENLDIDDDKIGDPECLALAQALETNRGLTHLSLVLSNNIGKDGISALITLTNSRLTSLDLNSNFMGDRLVGVLAGLLQHNSTIHSLDLGDNNIGDNGGIHLATALTHNSTLTSLNLGPGVQVETANMIGIEGTKAIAKALCFNSTLTNLSLRDNHGQTGTSVFATTLELNHTLTQLDLGGNYMGNEAVCRLADALTKNTSITSLNLIDNNIGEEGALALAGTLECNSTLIDLDLSCNAINNAGVCAIADALQNNGTLRRLNLDDNDFEEQDDQNATTQDILKPINDLLQRNHDNQLKKAVLLIELLLPYLDGDIQFEDDASENTQKCIDIEPSSISCIVDLSSLAKDAGINQNPTIYSGTSQTLFSNLERNQPGVSVIPVLTSNSASLYPRNAKRSEPPSDDREVSPKAKVARNG